MVRVITRWWLTQSRRIAWKGIRPRELIGFELCRECHNDYDLPYSGHLTADCYVCEVCGRSTETRYITIHAPIGVYE